MSRPPVAALIIFDGWGLRHATESNAILKAHTPVMDRIYFRSIYFREPSGILFEIATDTPGFTNDETVDELGAKLRLPPWLERARPQIEEVLPKIVLPTKATL